VSCPTEPAGRGSGARSCLIVDDSRTARQVARRILETLDFAIEEAVDGQLGLDACRRSMPTVILLDWNMPVLNGIDFLRSLRDMEGGDAPAVVFCTTMGDIRHIQEALGAGADEYIIKPFDAEVLREKFSRLGLL
jgi:two-component system, chemotaxis family, chemotaxis protein CheY